MEWSSYNATDSGKNIPVWLTVDWILGQFSKNRHDAQKNYRDFVADGICNNKSPLQYVVGQLILGEQPFIDKIKPFLSEKSELKEDHPQPAHSRATELRHALPGTFETQ